MSFPGKSILNEDAIATKAIMEMAIMTIFLFLGESSRTRAWTRNGMESIRNRYERIDTSTIDNNKLKLICTKFRFVYVKTNREENTNSVNENKKAM